MRGMTNAKRLALGLPPLPPRKREQATRSTPSSTPSNAIPGMVEVRNADINVSIGFISAIPLDFGAFTTTRSETEALIVRFDRVAAAAGPINIPTENGFPDFPFLGGAVGFISEDNLVPGSLDHCYLTGTNKTPVNSPPAFVGNSFTQATTLSDNSESAIWTLSPDGFIIPNWVNPDHTHPTCTVVFSQGILVFTGDFTIFTNVFGGQRVTLSFVPV